jgi:uncharacterized membrane protein YphA (DoxX/SURF4 family)
MQLAIGVFFITLGIAGLAEYNTALNEFARALGGQSDLLEILIAILELAAGVVLVVALFTPISSRALFIACIVILVLWGLWILSNHIVNNLAEPNFLVWLNRLALDVIPGIGIWMIAGRYR